MQMPFFLFPGLLFGLGEPSSPEKKAPSGNAVLRAKAGKSEIVLTTTARLAGAVHSLTWAGQEFIDSHDHGRQLQSAASFDVGDFKTYWPEAFNPTEAGSRRDGIGPTSSSKLLEMNLNGKELRAKTRMAFWLAPGEKSFGRPARNKAVLSDHLLEKRVKLGFKGLEHAIEYEVAFHLPEGEDHTYAQFEALTGYMPPEFDRFLKLVDGELKPLDDGPGEQEYPVVLATPSGSHAMGVFSPDQPSKGFEKAGYGRFRFKKEKVNKWNCVFRSRDLMGVRGGRHAFRVYVAVGSLEDVRRTLNELIKMFR